jgi:hypothetical protein
VGLALWGLGVAALAPLVEALGFWSIFLALVPNRAPAAEARAEARRDPVLTRPFGPG